MRRLLAIGTLAVGCAGGKAPATNPPTPQPIVTTPDPRPAPEPSGLVSPMSSASLDEIETNLLELDFLVRFEVKSEGAVESRIFGELRSERDRLTLSARGSFAGETVELAFEADGRELRGQSGQKKMSLPQPEALKESMVIGLTRMGILHNLAVLIAARPPDHADGGVREWVVADDVVFGQRIGPPEPGEDARRELPTAVSFGLIVAGQPAGEATLWVDTGANLPLERHQVVRFPQGEMRVTETYAVTPLRAN